MLQVQTKWKWKDLSGQAGWVWGELECVYSLQSKSACVLCAKSLHSYPTLWPYVL